MTEPSDRSLLRRLRAGDDEAAAAIYSRYAQRLRELARAHSSPELARRVEADEIVQSVFASFFRGADQGYYDLPAGEDLWKLFLVISLNKIRAKGNYHRAAKRDVRRTLVGEPYEHTLQTVAHRDQAAESLLAMTIEETLARLPEQHRAAIRLRIEGFEVSEIATKLGRSMRTTERLLQEARRHLADALRADEG